MSHRPSSVLAKLAAMVGSIDMTHAAGSVAMTMISGVNKGEFKTPIRYLGTVCYLVLEVSPVSCQPVIRGYSAGIGNYPHEVLFGAPRFNNMAHDPSGRSRLRPPQSDAVGLASLRMFPYMASGAHIIEEDQVQLPQILAQVNDDVLAKGANSGKLKALGKELRKNCRNWHRFASPVTGQVTEMLPTENENHYKLVIETVAGRHEVLVPAGCTLDFEYADGAPAPFVTAGQQLVRSLDGVRDYVCEDFAWMSLIQTITTPKGQEVKVVPFGYLSDAIRRKTVQVEALFEDVEPLLGPPIENPAKIVLAGIPNAEQINEGDHPVRAQAISRFRRELGDTSVFATDEDLLQGLQYPDDPLHLSGMAKIQHWTISHEKSMLLTRPECFADFQGMRPSWRRLLGYPDLEPVLHRVMTEAEKDAENYTEAALSVLRRYPTLTAKTIHRVEAMQNDNADHETVRTYLSGLHKHQQGGEEETESPEATYDDQHAEAVSGANAGQTAGV